MKPNWTTIAAVVGVLALLGVAVWKGRSAAEIAGLAAVSVGVVAQLAPAASKGGAP